MTQALSNSPNRYKEGLREVGKQNKILETLTSTMLREDDGCSGTEGAMPQLKYRLYWGFQSSRAEAEEESKIAKHRAASMRVQEHQLKHFASGKSATKRAVG